MKAFCLVLLALCTTQAAQAQSATSSPRNRSSLATVEPGTRPGESNIILDVREGGRPVEVSVGADNHGTRAAGSARVFASIDLNNPSGRLTQTWYPTYP